MFDVFKEAIGGLIETSGFMNIGIKEIIMILISFVFIIWYCIKIPFYSIVISQKWGVVKGIFRLTKRSKSDKIYLNLIFLDYFYL